ncbi:uncharacterized protein LOC116745508 [Phocoena sinus]|uniref:uncharacterized protein LOC116745508 n=1 Tax=Phocoena sinus TaxID=42100 RepID=UPI0013C4B0F2|nr:uncharacterized protein LOC116745508 [Phocoena sinus]
MAGAPREKRPRPTRPPSHESLESEGTRVIPGCDPRGVQLAGASSGVGPTSKAGGGAGISAASAAAARPSRRAAGIRPRGERHFSRPGRQEAGAGRRGRARDLGPGDSADGREGGFPHGGKMAAGVLGITYILHHAQKGKRLTQDPVLDTTSHVFGGISNYLEFFCTGAIVDNAATNVGVQMIHSCVGISGAARTLDRRGCGGPGGRRLAAAQGDPARSLPAAPASPAARPRARLQGAGAQCAGGHGNGAARQARKVRAGPTAASFEYRRRLWSGQHRRPAVPGPLAASRPPAQPRARPRGSAPAAALQTPEPAGRRARRGDCRSPAKRVLPGAGLGRPGAQAPASAAAGGR